MENTDVNTPVIDPSIHKYSMIEFICKGRKPTNKSLRIDFVPTSWVHSDLKKKTVFTKFPSPPYNEVTSEKLHALIKERADPAEEYKSYAIKVVGRSSKIFKFIFHTYKIYIYISYIFLK